MNGWMDGLMQLTKKERSTSGRGRKGMLGRARLGSWGAVQVTGHKREETSRGARGT